MLKKSILLVEDDEFLRDIYALKFKNRGFDIRTAGDGIEALAKIEEKVPQFLLLDILLPHIDGWQVLKKIQENPKLKEIIIITLSNLGQKEEVDKAIELGARKFLIKAHYEPNQVVREVEKILESE